MTEKEKKKEKDRQWYLKNREKKLAKVKAYREENRDKVNASAKAYRERPESKQIIREYNRNRRAASKQEIDKIKLRYGCQNPNCPVSDECSAEELDLHHRDPTKKEASIGSLRKDSRKKVVTEIEKCHVLCAICHRRVHLGLVECEQLDLVKVNPDEYQISSSDTPELPESDLA